jgi:hypothetical protein
MGAGMVSEPALTAALDEAREQYAVALRVFLSRRLLTSLQVENVLAGFEDGFRAGYALGKVDGERAASPPRCGNWAGCPVCLPDGDEPLFTAPTVDDAPSDGEE